jgi:hypothetical protein
LVSSGLSGLLDSLDSLFLGLLISLIDGYTFAMIGIVVEIKLNIFSTKLIISDVIILLVSLKRKNTVISVIIVPSGLKYSIANEIIFRANFLLLFFKFDEFNTKRDNTTQLISNKKNNVLKIIPENKNDSITVIIIKTSGF